MAQKRASSKKSAARKSTKAATRKSKEARKSGKAATRSSKKSATRKSIKAVTRKSIEEAKFAFGVTTIREISNFTETYAKLTNTQNGQAANAPPNDTAQAGVDIPWADDYPTFHLRHVVIEIDTRPKYYLFQKNGLVEYCTGLSQQAYSERKEVDGYYQGDGDRVLIIRSGTLEMQRT